MTSEVNSQILSRVEIRENDSSLSQEKTSLKEEKDIQTKTDQTGRFKINLINGTISCDLNWVWEKISATPSKIGTVIAIAAVGYFILDNVISKTIKIS